MSKLKKENCNKNIPNENFPIEKKYKKKLNKRQRKIKKKMKDIIKGQQQKSKSTEMKSNFDENMSKTLEKPDDSKLVNNSDICNSKNYSANWRQLKQTLSNSGKNNFQNPKRRKISEELNKKSTMNSETSLINNKSLGTKYAKDVGVTKVIEDQAIKQQIQPNSLKTPNSFMGRTKAVAIDCEMVGGGFKGEVDLLARVSIVNQYGNVLLDKYVKPREDVVDFRTEFSGIRPEDLVNAESFDVIQKKVSELLSGKIVVGHGVKNDFRCLLISHPKRMIRDTSKYKPFRKTLKGGTPKLRDLSEKILGIQIQSGEHDSVQDAQAAMRLYYLHRNEWEKAFRIGINGVNHKVKKR